MKCNECESDNIVKNGLRRGVQCFLCKDCGHQFTNDKKRYSNCDIYLALLLYTKYVKDKKYSDFIHSELRLIHIAKLLDCKYTTVYFWVHRKHIANIKVSREDLIMHLKNHKRRRDILGLLYSNKVKYQPSAVLLDIVKQHK